MPHLLHLRLHFSAGSGPQFIVAVIGGCGLDSGAPWHSGTIHLETGGAKCAVCVPGMRLLILSAASCWVVNPPHSEVTQEIVFKQGGMFLH